MQENILEQCIDSYFFAETMDFIQKRCQN